MVTSRGTTAVLAVAAMSMAVLAASSASTSTAPQIVASASPTSAPASAPTSAAPEVNPAGDIPDNQVFVPWVPADKTFTVSVPEGWARTDNGAATVFTDKLNTISIESSAQASQPTAASETAAVTSAVGAQPGFSLGAASSVERAGGSAVLLTYEVDASADPVTGKVVHDAVERYTFWNSGTAVTLTLSGPTGADNVDPWRIVTDSFGWTP